MAKYNCLFDQAATNRYTALRYIPKTVLDKCAALIVGRAIEVKSSKKYIRILEAGSGTGRFVFPVMENALKKSKQFEFVAIDLSEYMMSELVQTYRDQAHLSRIKLMPIVADLQEKFFVGRQCVDVVYTVATFHILEKWRQAVDNIAEIITKGGSFIIVNENNQFMHQTEGFERDCDFDYLDDTLSEFMRYYHFLRKKYEHPYEPSEVRYSDMRPLLWYLDDLGFTELDIDYKHQEFQWQKPHNYVDILHCFKYRQMTTWGSDLSAEIRKLITNDLDNWLEKKNVDRQKDFLLPAQLIPYVFSRE